MSSKEIICEAISNLRLLQFVYNGTKRVVEPHQLAYNVNETLSLSAWWVRGHSDSHDTIDRWRYFHLPLANVRRYSDSFSTELSGVVFNLKPNFTNCFFIFIRSTKMALILTSDFVTLLVRSISSRIMYIAGSSC